MATVTMEWSGGFYDHAHGQMAMTDATECGHEVPRRLIGVPAGLSLVTD